MSEQPESELPHRRRRSNWWKSTPRGVKVTVVACLALVMVGGFVIEQRWFKDPPPTSVPPPPNPGEVFDAIKEKMAPIDLVLSKSSLNATTKRIEGLVTNNSERPYSNIQVSFYLPNRNMADSEVATVTIERLGPHDSARFATDPLNPDLKEWSLRDIKGTPGGPATPVQHRP